MPDITINMNCDNRLAINLDELKIGDKDEFIFAIKNYDHIDSPYAFLFRTRTDYKNKNGEVIFKISSEETKKLKPGAFYNFAILLNAYDTLKETEYRKLTSNGKVYIEYGAQDILVPKESMGEIIKAAATDFDYPVLDRTSAFISQEIVDATIVETMEGDTNV
jgi:hypothetical protein